VAPVPRLALFPTSATVIGAGSRVFRTVAVELRFEPSYAPTAYNNGARKNQFSFAVDVAFKF
jgi:hypothetical protein